MFNIGFGISFLNHLQVDIPVPDPDQSHHTLVFVNVDDVQPDLLSYYFGFQSLPGFLSIGLAWFIHMTRALICFGRFRGIYTIQADPEFCLLFSGDLDCIAV